MKANRNTIPALVLGLEPFENTSGTLKGVVNPESLPTGRLDATERDRLRIDSDQSGIQYVVISYGTPIAWVTNSGWTYKVRQTLTQTTTNHMGLLHTLPEGFNPAHRKTPKS